MPSLILGNPPASGAQLIFSGNLLSGRLTPAGGIQLRWLTVSGNAYISTSLSGGGPPLSGAFMTINSGQLLLSGGILSGLLDGTPMTPGDGLFVPMQQLPTLRAGPVSGTITLWALCDLGASGVGRLYVDLI